MVRPLRRQWAFTEDSSMLLQLQFLLVQIMLYWIKRHLGHCRGTPLSVSVRPSRED